MSDFNMQYLKRKHFSHRIQFHIEKVWFIWRKIEKIKFFQFFCQNRCWPLVFERAFLKFVPKNFRSESACALEGFWNQKSPKESSLCQTALKWRTDTYWGGSRSPLHWLGLRKIVKSILAPARLVPSSCASAPRNACETGIFRGNIN